MQFEEECQTLRSSLSTVESKCQAAQSQVAQLKEKMASLDHVLRVSHNPALPSYLHHLNPARKILLFCIDLFGIYLYCLSLLSQLFFFCVTFGDPAGVGIGSFSGFKMKKKKCRPGVGKC